MSRLMVCGKLGRAALALGAMLFVGPCRFFVAAAQEQQSQQPPPPPPPQNAQPAPDPAALIGELPVKRRKVWTNDDVVSLRTPTDDYLAEKEAKEAADAKAAAESAARPEAIKENTSENKLPTTIEETQLLIKNKEQDIDDDQTTLTSLNTELGTVPEEQKKAKQKEIDIVGGELDRARKELKALQDHLVELQKPPANESTAEPPPPPTS